MWVNRRQKYKRTHARLCTHASMSVPSISSNAAVTPRDPMLKHRAQLACASNPPTHADPITCRPRLKTLNPQPSTLNPKP